MKEELDISHQIIGGKKLEIITLQGHFMVPVNIDEEKKHGDTENAYDT